MVVFGTACCDHYVLQSAYDPGRSAVCSAKKGFQSLQGVGSAVTLSPNP